MATGEVYMAHADDLLRHTDPAAQALRKKIQMYDHDTEAHLMPLHLNYVVSATIVDRELKTSWADYDGTYKTDRPVQCGIFNLSAALEPNPAEMNKLEDTEIRAIASKTFAEAHRAVADLRKIGVNAFLKTHTGRINGRTGKPLTQILICLPFLNVEKRTETYAFQSNIDNGIVLLAYLLNKRWISEDDIPKESVRRGQILDTGAFSIELLRHVSDENVQNRLGLLNNKPGRNPGG